jgi:transposase-like protein
MKKRAKKRVVWQGGRPERISEGLKTLLRPMVEGIEATRQGLLELFHVAGVEALRRQLAGDVEAMVGPKRRRDPDREAYRWGTTPSEFVLGGRKVALERPRVRRRAGGEVTLPSVSLFQDEDPFTERVIEQTLLGVSQRGYARSLEALEPVAAQRATSKSAVQRRLVAGTRRVLEEWLHRDLAEFQPLILMLDGLEIAGQTLLVALGIDRDGTKRVLGLREGATENAAVCVALLQELLDRHLCLPERFLVVLDGAKGLRKAVRSVFGESVCVQRCQFHKRRNVRDHLPKELQTRVDRLMVAAYRSESFTLAKRRLDQLARWLDREGHSGAAASVREGLEETLTVLQLKLPEALRRLLCSTNAIENTIGSIRRTTRNVKRWRGGDMKLRWVALALCEAEARFHRVKGHRHLGALELALATLEERAATKAVA